jgi:hypothetical protein
MKDEMEIIFTHGSKIFKARPWHAGRYVTVDINGYNWRIHGDEKDDVTELDQLIIDLENRKSTRVSDHRSTVSISFENKSVLIIGKDHYSSRYPGLVTDNSFVLDEDELKSFIEVLKFTSAREKIDFDKIMKEHEQHLKRINAMENKSLWQKIAEWFNS